MDDLQQSQIHSSCRLAMPEGLQDLMSDISREVLRAQPRNLLKFITDYLSALLVTRENLAVSSCLCDDICLNPRAKDLEDDLIEIGICSDDIKTIQKIVDKYIEKMKACNFVKECSIVSDIMCKTSVPADNISEVLKAIRKSFTRHQAYNNTIYEITPESSLDDVALAAQHTINLYRQTKPTEEEYHKAARTIQVQYARILDLPYEINTTAQLMKLAAYRAYGVTRQMTTEKSRTEWFYAPDVIERADLKNKEIDDESKSLERRINFDTEIMEGLIEKTDSENFNAGSADTEKTEDIYMAYNCRQTSIESLVTLVGSQSTYYIEPMHCQEVIEDIIEKRTAYETTENNDGDIDDLDNSDDKDSEVLTELFESQSDDVESENSIKEEITVGNRNSKATADNESDDEVIIDQTEYNQDPA